LHSGSDGGRTILGVSDQSHELEEEEEEEEIAGSRLQRGSDAGVRGQSQRFEEEEEIRGPQQTKGTSLTRAVLHSGSDDGRENVGVGDQSEETVGKTVARSGGPQQTKRTDVKKALSPPGSTSGSAGSRGAGQKSATVSDDEEALTGHKGRKTLGVSDRSQVFDEEEEEITADSGLGSQRISVQSDSARRPGVEAKTSGSGGSQKKSHKRQIGQIPTGPEDTVRAAKGHLLTSAGEEEDNFEPLLGPADAIRLAADDSGHSSPGRSAREIARQFGIELSDSEADEEVDPSELAEALRMTGDL
jgi:hypothetical protein